MKRLIDICDIQYGYAFDSKCFTEDSSYPQLVRIRDVKRGYSETYYSGDYPEEYILSEGDLLVGMDGEFNIARWKCSGALLNQRVCKLVAKIGTNEEYLRFAMSKSLKEIEQRTAFVTVKHLSAKELNKLELDVPELTKQDKIADILSRLERVIEARKEELEELGGLIKARFVEMFGDLADPECSWNKRKLIEVCVDKDDIKCGPFGTQLSKDEYMESGIAVWEIPQINIAFKSRPVHFITSEKSEQLKAYTIIPGDIAMSRKGNVGKCAIFPESYPAGIIHSDVLRIRLNSQVVNPMFMMCQLHFSGAVTRQIELVSSGAIMAGVNVTKLKQIYVHIPPIELQNQFADFVRVVDKSKFIDIINLLKILLFFKRGMYYGN